MDPILEKQRNQEAFRRLKASISETFPTGRFVAISNAAIVADAEDLDSLLANLRAKGREPNEVLVVQSGIEYPESATILVFGV
jgi:Family of unknown function (DUF5678)